MTKSPVWLSERVQWIGALDPTMRSFDIILKTPNGTTYNAYVVRGSEGVAVIDTVKAECAYQFFERIARFFVSERAISSWKRANCSRCSFAMSDGSDSLLGIKGKGSKKLQKIVFFKQTALKNERFIRKSHKRIIHVAFFYRVTRTIR